MSEKDINRWGETITPRDKAPQPWVIGSGGSWDMLEVQPIPDEMLSELARRHYSAGAPWNCRSMPLSASDREYMFLLHYSMQGLVARMRLAEKRIAELEAERTAIASLDAVAMPLTDAEINDITSAKLGKWPSFAAQSWACKVVHAVAERVASEPAPATPNDIARMFNEWSPSRAQPAQAQAVPQEDERWIHEDMARIETEAVSGMARKDLRDAYIGARDDLAIWKSRALEAEELCRRQAATLPQPAAPVEQAVRAPEGHKIVPLEPTLKMMHAWDAAPFNEDYNLEFAGAYRAMLEAAPAQDGGE